VWTTDGDVTTYGYAGRMTTVTDPKGKWKKYSTDEFGNLVQVECPGSARNGEVASHR